MPMIDLVPRLRELGRIRTGNQVTSKGGKRVPNKLETFRLTSPSEALITAAQAIYGGERQPWTSPAGKQFELVTTVATLPIVIPSGESLSQWYEMWSAGGCQRRCDGRTEMLSDGPCLCPNDAGQRRELASRQTPEACKPVTRLNVVLPDIPDLGVWRLESHGYYAAVELAGATQFLAAASAAGMNIPAHLRLDQREKKVPGQPINRYAVPVIEFTSIRIVDLVNAGAGPTMLGEGIPPAQQLAPGSLVPARPERAPRQPRVERPALGPAPTVPTGEGFGRRQPVNPTAPPPALGSGVVDEPESVAGFVIDDAPVSEPRSVPEEASPLSTSTPDESAAAAAAPEPTDDPDEVPGLTRDELVEGLRVLGINTGEAAKRSMAMWPDRGEVPLSDAQRLELLTVLRDEKAATAAASL